VSEEKLEHGTVHLYLCEPESITDPSLINRYHRLMTPREAEKQARFHFPRHRHQYLVTRALVRTVLSRYAPVAPEAWRFEENEYGRPHIAAAHGQSGLRFNLSHTDGLIVCAVTRDAEIGVDVENISRGGDLVQIADRFFSPSEVADLHKVPTDRQEDRFFDYWTLKESYIKARGMGLSIPLGDFSFHLSDENDDITITIAEKQGDDPARWQFCQWRHGSEHKIALCLEAKDQAFSIVAKTSQPFARDSCWYRAPFRSGPKS